jgi:drug/metabolite transporter (DMT)-like permease
MLGPTITLGFGWLVLSEALSAWQVLGTGATLLGVYLAQGRAVREPTPQALHDNGGLSAGAPHPRRS